MKNLSVSLSSLMLLALLAVLPVRAQSTPPLDRFELSIQAFEAKDKRTPPALHASLFIGSSTFTLWGATLEKEFKSFRAVNRGFGGATIPEINHYFKRLVVPYHPRRIVFYAGTNDIADGRTPQQVATDFATFVDLAKEAVPNVSIAFISMSMPPSRVQFEANYRKANRLIADYANNHDNVLFVDVSQLLLDPQGRPRPEYFREDQLHMKPIGYALWIPYIWDALEEMP